jgi:hypothetical protein
MLITLTRATAVEPARNVPVALQETQSVKLDKIDLERKWQ